MEPIYSAQDGLSWRELIIKLRRPSVTKQLTLTPNSREPETKHANRSIPSAWEHNRFSRRRGRVFGRCSGAVKWRGAGASDDAHAAGEG
jgi:hypothetical protein